MNQDSSTLRPEDIEALQRLQQSGNVHVHSGSKPVRQNDLSTRTIGTMIAGAAGAVAGYAATNVFIDRKMSDFWTEVDATTKSDLLGRGGIGGAIADANAFTGGGGNSFAAGLANQEIQLSNARTLAKSGKYGKIPKFIFDYSREGSAKNILATAGALAVGGVAAGVAYSALKSDKPKEPEGNWADKIENAPETKRDLS